MVRFGMSNIFGQLNLLSQPFLLNYYLIIEISVEISDKLQYNLSHKLYHFW